MELRGHKLGDLKMCQTLTQVCAASEFSQSIANLTAASLINFSLSHTVTPSNCIGSYQRSCSNHNIKSRPPRNGTRQTNNRLINPIAKWPPPTMDHRCPSPGSRCFQRKTTDGNQRGIQRLSFQTSQDWSFQTGPCFGLPMAKRVEGAVVLWCCLFLK